MRPNESFIAQPIRSLQTMLRVLAEHDSRYFRIIPDGIYGPQTMTAVSAFQRNHGLPVTGVTDQTTWDAIVAAYEPALVQVVEAQPLQIILNPNQVICRGETSPYLYVVQAILLVLSKTYSSVAMPSQSGVLDSQTFDSIASFQVLCGLPMTGQLDKITWKHLALQYPMAANIGRGTPRDLTNS